MTKAADNIAGLSDATGASPPENPSDTPIYERLGGIVRILRDSLHELGHDRVLTSASTQVNDAQSRLEYIATLTEEAATKVLNAIELSIPSQDALAKNAHEISGRWSALYEGNLSHDDLKILADESRRFSRQVVESSEAEKARLLEIMMAQGFQDITGQLIKRIVKITHALESELTQLLLDHAPEIKMHSPTAAAPKPVDLMEGPLVPTEALAQNDVDNLLGDLGL